MALLLPSGNVIGLTLSIPVVTTEQDCEDADTVSGGIDCSVGAEGMGQRESGQITDWFA